MSATTTQPSTSRQRSRVPWSTDLATVGAAIVCALVLWASVTLLGGLDLEARSGGTVRQVGGASVTFAAALAGLLGTGTLRVLERITPRALTIWTVLAVVVAVLSLAGTLGATTASAMGTLMGLHLLVAVVLLVGAHRSRAAWARA